MKDSVAIFLKRARRGEPVFINEVRLAFEGFEGEPAFHLGLELILADGLSRVFEFRLPCFSTEATGPERDEMDFIRDYFMAELYNIISCLGLRSIRFLDPDRREEAAHLYSAFRQLFGLNQGRHFRSGYGRCLNVAERMLDALDGRADSRVEASFESGTVESTGWSTRPNSSASLSESEGLASIRAKALGGTAGTSILGIDVGGTDIKLALSVNGKLTALEEFDWFPASFTRIDQLIEPILSLVRAMSKRVSGGLFDSIGLSFPDVVVRDKIVGGEVYKTRGIRENTDLDYEAEFKRLTDLDLLLSASVKKGGRVTIVNDGPMAAFTALVEAENAGETGIFAHTLGTELGTGWVKGDGVIPDIPLEVYNCIIDLGSFPERAFESDDARSVNNFNTKLPGTLQKYTSQSGAFRLALKYFPEGRPKIYAELLAAGYLVERPVPGDPEIGQRGIYVPTEPVDMRKPLLEFLMRLDERGPDPLVDRIFTEIGEFLAVASIECERILRPDSQSRILFGRMVKRSSCFDSMVRGGRRILPTLDLRLAAEDMATTPLMQELKANANFTVAQFAQAIGAIHYAAYRSISDKSEQQY